MSHKSIAFGKIKGPKKIESYNSFKHSVMEYTFKKNYTWTSQLVLLQFLYSFYRFISLSYDSHILIVAEVISLKLLL